MSFSPSSPLPLWALLLVLVLLSLCPPPSAWAAPCPVSTPSPLNPVGCVLSSTLVTAYLSTPTGATYDGFAQPNTVVLADGNNNAVVVFYTNATRYKALSTGSGPAFNNPDQGTVDTNGFLYIPNRSNGDVHIFSPYPAYTYITVIVGLTNSESDASLTINGGEYLFVGNDVVSLQAYRLTFGSNPVSVVATPVGSTNLPTSDSSYHTGVFIDPATGQVAFGRQDGYIGFLTVNYTNPTALTFALNRSFTAANSGLSLLNSIGSIAMTSVQIDTAERLVVMAESSGGDLWLLFLSALNGSILLSAPIDTTAGFGGTFSYSAIKPDGSLIFVPSTTGRLIILQGYYTNTSLNQSPASALTNVSSAVTALNPAGFGGRQGARYAQQSLLANAYLPTLLMLGPTTGTGAVWQSTDGGTSWSPLDSNLTLSAIPTLQGAAVAYFDGDGVLAIYGGQLANGSATSLVAWTNTLFASAPVVYTAPFGARYNHAYTTLPGSNTTVFCAGLSSTGATANNNNCWKGTRPELGASAWVQQTASGPFPSALSNAALVSLYDATSTLLLCGGLVVFANVSNAVATCWVSLDVGVTWTAAIVAPWTARSGHVMTSDLDGWAYLYGGTTAAGAPIFDLWLSTNKASTWLQVFAPVGPALPDIAGGCLALVYSKSYVSNTFGTWKNVVLYSGYQPSLSALVQGDYFVALEPTTPILVPPIQPLNLSVPLVQSQCQFTLTVAGTLMGFGASGINPNPLQSAALIAALVGALLSIPASAVQVCVHVEYAYLLTLRTRVYIVSPGPALLNATAISAATNTTLVESASYAAIVGAPVSSSSTGDSGAASSTAAGSVAGSSSSTASSSVVGDPQFVGLRGQRYQVHGIDGAVYSLIRDRGLLLNARFAFLSGGHCPADVGGRAISCWSHAGSYLGELGLRTSQGSTLTVISGSAARGFNEVAVDGQALSVGDRVQRMGLSVELLSSHALRFSAGNWEVEVDNSDRFVNLASVRVLQWSEVQHSHGLLGQTWRTAEERGEVRGQEVREVEGVVDDYAEHSNQLLGTQFTRLPGEQ